MERIPSLRPREHGATAQVLVCLGACLLAGPFQTGALLPAGLLALAVLLAFLSAEPLLVLAGFRGEATRQALATAARRRLIVLGLPAAASLGAALVLRPDLAPALLLPALPAGLLALRFARQGVYGATSESLAALAMATLAFPLRRAAGMDVASAGVFTGLLALLYLHATVSVRLLLRSRGVQRPWLGRLPIPGLALLAAGLIGLFHPEHVWPLLPACVGGGVLLVAPPTRLKTLGWLLAAQTTAGALLLAAFS